MRRPVLGLVLLTSIALAPAVAALPAGASAAAPRPAITGVSPFSDSYRGGKPVLIGGTNLDAVTAVRFGNTATTRIQHLSSTLIRVTSPAHALGTVYVRAIGAGGTSRTSAQSTYRFIKNPPHLAWTDAGAMPRTKAGPLPLKTVCVAVDKCYAGGRDGYLLTFDGNWHQRRVDPSGSYFAYISCPSAAFCLAVAPRDYGDISGNPVNGRNVLVARINGTWRTPVTFDGGHDVLGVTCGGAGLCLAWDDHGTVTEIRHGTVAGTSRPSRNPVQQVSCASSTWCLAVTADPPPNASPRTYELIFDGRTWSTERRTAFPVPTQTLECRSPQFCVAVAGQFSFRRDGVWSTKDKGNAGVLAVSCPTLTFCVLDNGDTVGVGVTIARNGGLAAYTRNPVPSSGVSCPTDTWCFAAGSAVNSNSDYTIGRRVP